MAGVELCPAQPEVCMKSVAALVSLVGLFVSAAPVSAQFPPFERVQRFDLGVARSATHILVVNPQGSVLEVWKGSAQLGEVIPIYALANLTLTQSERPEGVAGLSWGAGIPVPRSYVTLSPWLTCSDRIILFLIKSDVPDPTSCLLNGWFPASPSGFRYSIAQVHRTGYVFVEPPSVLPLSGLPDGGFRGSFEFFKDCALGLWDPVLQTNPKK
jgi:hypothetical protein